MRRIEDLQEYRALTKGKKLHANTFLPEEVTRHVQQGRLFCSGTDALAALFFDEYDFAQLVLAGELTEDAALPETPEKELVCHVVEEAGERGPLHALLPGWGFRLRCTVNELAAELGASPERAVCPEGYAFSDRSDYARTVALWKSALPVYEMPHVTEEEFSALCEKGRILCLREEKTGRDACVGYFDSILGATTLHHIVTRPDCRGKGLARAAVQRWLETAAGNRRARVWVEEGNAASRRLFDRCGFRETGRVSYQYIR